MSKEALIDIVKNILRIKKIRYLLIFDNPESYQEIEKYIPYVPHDQSGGHILLTSRNGSIWTDTLHVGKFKREESLCLIKAALPKEKDEDVESLAETLSDYPLGLKLAIGFIKPCPTATIPKYIFLHMKRTLTTKENPPNPVLDTYPNDAQTGLEISLKAIKEKHKDALQALFFMSLLNSKDVPESYIEIWLKKIASPLTADEAIKYIFDQSLVGVSETAEFHENKQIEKRQMTHYLSIHDLIHQLINETIPKEEEKRLIDTAAKVMLDVFSGLAETFTKKITKEPIHLLHAQKLCAHAKKIKYSSNKLLELKVCILQCLTAAFRDFEAAQFLLEDIEEGLEMGFALDPYYEALLKINKGSVEHIRANYNAAIQLMNEGLIILNPYKKYKGEKLRAITNLIQYHAMKGESNKADELIKRGNAIFETLHSSVYNSFFIYASSIALNDQGKFKESLTMLNKTNAFPMLSIDYPPVYHGVLLQKIESYLKLRKFEVVVKYIEELEKKTKEFYTKKSVMLANILLVKSILSFFHKKEPSHFVPYMKEALQIYENSFQGSKKHRYQGRAHLVLGKTCALNKDFKNALKEYLLSEEIYDLVLKEKKIDDVSDLYKALALLGIAMKDDGLTHKYLKAHMDTFGRLHPRTQEILLSLDRHGLVAPF